MTLNPEKISTKRRRGRPKGSAPFKDKDLELLRRLATHLVREPGLKVTTVLKGLGVKNESDLARLRKRWRENSVDLMDCAKLDLHRPHLGGVFGKMMEMSAGFTVRVNEILQAVPVDQIVQRVQAYHDVKQAMLRQGANRDVGFDTTHPEEIIAAIGRLEGRDPTIYRDIVKKDDDGVDLNNWEHQYVMAVVLHEMAMEGWQKEQEQDDDKKS